MKAFFLFSKNPLSFKERLVRLTNLQNLAYDFQSNLYRKLLARFGAKFLHIEF